MKGLNFMRPKGQPQRSRRPAASRRREPGRTTGLRARLRAWHTRAMETLMQDEWVRSLAERRQSSRISGLEKLHRHQRRKALEQEAAQLVGLKARLGFAVRHHKVVVTAAMGLAVAIFLGGVGMGASYLASQKSVTLLIGEEERYCMTTLDRVDELLKDQGIFPGNGLVEPSGETLLVSGMTIRYYPRMSVVVDAAGRQQRYFFYRGTVADALAAANLILDEDDVVTPTPDTPLADGMTVKLTRYAINTVVERQRLHFEEKVLDEPTLYVGQKKVLQEGREGELVRTVQVRYEDGLELEREVISEIETLKPRNAIVLKGTKPTPKPTPTPTPKPTPTPTKKPQTKTAAPKATAKPTAKATATPKKTAQATKTPTPTKASIPGTPDTFEKKLSMEVTAYTHTGNKTALGTWPVATRTRSNPGTVAVAPQTIPYHTLLYVPGYGYCLAEDTGGFRDRNPNMIDLFMDTQAECVKWGRKRDYTVYIVEYNYRR